jgi:two-component system, OmpR family, sensor kinase
VRSIRQRLLAVLLLGVCAAAALAGLATYLKARTDINELFDYQLKQMALSLRFQEFLRADAGEYDDEGNDFLTQVWDTNGVLLYYSKPGIELPRRLQLGFSTVSWRNQDWRVYTTLFRNHVIQTAQPLSLRQQMAASAALRIMIPILALVPLLAVLVWMGVGQGLRPLNDIAAALRLRKVEEMRPLPIAGLPDEIRPMIEALNDLLARLAGALETQRQFTADAAHELRSPLTALKLQMQLAERSATTAERAEAFHSLKLGVERATRLVQQLLTLARLEPGQDRAMASVELDQLARNVTADFAALAQSKGVDLGFNAAGPVVIMGNADALRVMLGNLIDNAIQYTPPGGKADVKVGDAGQDAVVEVSDTGPGIPPEERERVFDRFYRPTGSPGPGSGLGLAIVKKIADNHAARISLETGEGGTGLRVQVFFRRA